MEYMVIGICVQQWQYAFFHMTDTYILDIKNPDDALHVLMLVLAIDAEKCSAAAATSAAT